MEPLHIDSGLTKLVSDGKDSIIEFDGISLSGSLPDRSKAQTKAIRAVDDLWDENIERVRGNIIPVRHAEFAFGDFVMPHIIRKRDGRLYDVFGTEYEELNLSDESSLFMHTRVDSNKSESGLDQRSSWLYFVTGYLHSCRTGFIKSFYLWAAGIFQKLRRKD